MKKSFKAKSTQRLTENVEFRHLDKDGNEKLLWSDNVIGSFLLRVFRKFLPNGSKLALYGIRVPFLTGSWGNVLSFHNLITNAGFAGGASRLNGASGEAVFIYIAVGTGTTAADVTDTALETEITDSGLPRASASASRDSTGGITNDTAVLENSFSVSATKAVTESGVLNAGSGGTLLARQTFSAVNVVSGDTLAVTWKFTVS